jgi:hypothetical protein
VLGRADVGEEDDHLAILDLAQEAAPLPLHPGGSRPWSWR